MFPKIFTLASFLLFLVLQAQGHTIITPALHVKGKGARSDVRRPDDKTPCGNVGGFNKINDAVAVQADADGKFTMTITNFNKNADGSRQVTAKANAVGPDGKYDVQVKMLKNGDPSPPQLGSEQITGQLPAGTKCNAGANNNLCMVSLVTTRGFGNCVVVRQGAAKAAREYPQRAGTLAARSLKQRQEENLTPITPEEVQAQSDCLPELKKRALALINWLKA